MSTYSSRLQQALDGVNQDRKSLALAINCSVQAVGMALISKKDRPFSTVAHCRAARFLLVDPHWLATGEGEMTGLADRLQEPQITSGTSNIPDITSPRIQRITASLLALPESKLAALETLLGVVLL